MSEADDPKIAVSVEMKVNLGNYESAGASIVVSGLKAGATPEEIETLLDTGKLAWSLMSQRLGAKVNEMRTGSAKVEAYRAG